jgi:ankyrin repeat protein
MPREGEVFHRKRNCEQSCRDRDADRAPDRRTSRDESSQDDAGQSDRDSQPTRHSVVLSSIGEFMDAKFLPAVAAIESGDVDGLRKLIKEDPALATARSSTSHPTLLQCVVLQGSKAPRNLEMVQLLVDAGAELNEPLVACGSCDNAEAAALLLDHGVAINGSGGWTLLEEALYWNSRRTIDLLVRRGASIHNLRIAAGLGRTDLIESFFNEDGTLKPEAGPINWPWGAGRSWKNDRQGILNNAFLYACMHGHIPAAKLLLEKGAQVNAIPGGFDFAGTGLHYAALNGHQDMVEFLLHEGADVRIKDTKVGGTAAGWAEYGGHPAIKQYSNPEVAKDVRRYAACRPQRPGHAGRGCAFRSPEPKPPAHIRREEPGLRTIRQP